MKLLDSSSFNYSLSCILKISAIVYISLIETACNPPSYSRYRLCQLLVRIYNAKLYKNYTKEFPKHILLGILKLIDCKFDKLSEKIDSGTLTRTRFLRIEITVSLAIGDESTSIFKRVWMWQGFATLLSISRG